MRRCEALLPPFDGVERSGQFWEFETLCAAIEATA